MSKIQALTTLCTTLEQRIEVLVQQYEVAPTAQDSDSIQVLQELRAEMLAHLEMLGYAQLACEMGQEGRVPDQWDAPHPFDPYVLLLEALSSLPHGGQFSQPLLDYFNDLPQQKRAVHDQIMATLREDATPTESAETMGASLLDYFNELAGRPAQGHLLALLARRRAGDTTPPANPLLHLTEQEIGRFSMAISTKYLAATAFVVTYPDDVARAIELGQQHADWQKISACLE